MWNFKEANKKNKNKYKIKFLFYWKFKNKQWKALFIFFAIVTEIVDLLIVLTCTNLN